MLRSILSVVSGYILMMVIITIYFAIIMFIKFGGFPNPNTVPEMSASLIVIILLLDLLTGGVGGYVTGWIAQKDEFQHTLWLSIITFVIGAVMSAASWGKEPGWYVLSRQVGMFFTILIGGRIRSITKKA